MNEVVPSAASRRFSISLSFMMGLRLSEFGRCSCPKLGGCCVALHDENFMGRLGSTLTREDGRVTVCPQPRSRLRPLRAPNASGAEFSPSWDSPLTPDSRSRTPAVAPATRPFGLRRLSVLMEPNPGDANEACGVLN